MKYYITTPLYYVNANPHIGHAYTTILADVISRYRRLEGYDVLFLTGTDEHGQKILEAARNAGKSPLEHCDFYAERFRTLWDKLDIKYDDFIRTTEPRHQKVVTEVLKSLWDKGEIYSSNYEGWYCVPDERFWTDKDIVDGNCPDCGRPVTQIEEKNYFFKMSKYQDWLIDHIENNPDFIQPQSRRNEILGFLRKPLNDLCISRPKSRLEWGIPLPFDGDYVTYVWFDALLNYITAPGYSADMKRFGEWWPADMQLMAKDIITTHAVYWPTMLKAAGVEPPRTVFAHGWWMVEESKMGKSLGNAVDPHFLVDNFGRDQFRYFLMRGMVLGQDSQYNFERMVDVINTELANNLGNMVSRLFKMIGSYLNGKLPGEGEYTEQDTELVDSLKQLPDSTFELVNSMKIDRALSEINITLNSINSYLETMAPWKLSKDESQQQRLSHVLYIATESLRIISVLLFPVMPGKMTKVLKEFGEEVPPVRGRTTWGLLEAGRPTSKPKNLFPRIDIKQFIKDEKPPQKQEQPKENIVEYDHFAQLDLRVAKVLSAERAENADKLLLLKIDIGEDEPRPLVAGLAAHYEPEELVGKNIVVIANLKPAKIRGHISQGMLMAADDGKSVVLLEPAKDIKPGSKVR